MLNSLDPDQARHFVGPDLGANFFQRLSAEDNTVVGKALIRPDSIMKSMRKTFRVARLYACSIKTHQCLIKHVSVTLYRPETPELVPLQTVKTQMKCCIMWYFIRVITGC